MDEITRSVRATVAERALLPEGSPLLALVSGGGDSVALLHLAVQGAFGARPLRVLHVNHELRGADSLADERFVTALCDELSVDCRVVSYDVAGYARAEGLNLEDAGRRVRYRFADEELDALCAHAGMPSGMGRILVAHTAEDRIETFFMRALFGSGTGGLGSIPYARGRIVRPLLDVGREEVRAWLTRQGGSWREDATNDDTSRLRSAVRNLLLPAAEAVNPAFRPALVRTMDLLADDDALLTRMAESFVADFAEIEPGVRIAFACEWMRTLDRTMARRTVRAALAQAFPESSRLEAEHIEAIAHGLLADSFARDLPGGLRASLEYGTMIVSRPDEPAQTLVPNALPVPGVADLGSAGTITARFASVGDTQGSADSVVVDVGDPGRELVVDSVRPGDRLRPLGMEGTKKVSDVLIDGLVTRRMRGLVPIVRCGDEIVWVAGLRMSEDFRVTEQSARTVRLDWQRGDAWNVSDD